MKTIEIDGSHGEGGGQILRTSLALAMCTGQPFVLKNIRAKRAKPGLMRQHLTCVNAAAEVSSAQVQGAELNSQYLEFTPNAVRAGKYNFNVGSAGSCTLVLQTVWPALMLADGASDVEIRGGTHNHMAPPFDFIQLSYAPLVRKLGAPVELNLRRHGFYPAGGGVIHARFDGSIDNTLVPFDLMERGEKLDAYAVCINAGVPHAVAQRELRELAKQLGWQEEQLRLGTARQNEGPGNVLLAVLQHEHVCEVASRMGAKGVTSEQVAQSLAKDVRAWQNSDAALGEHMADQWVLPLALAVWKTGKPARYTCTKLTQHTRTNFETIAKFLPLRFETDVQEHVITVRVSPA